mmetsp:Transcript_14929/g.44716  ORF Transcript_14929/g.44716 Transcript_14929/m.44716 type:complete len:378 (-) Transcript_14929:359-1492(-)
MCLCPARLTRKRRRRRRRRRMSHSPMWLSVEHLSTHRRAWPDSAAPGQRGTSIGRHGVQSSPRSEERRADRSDRAPTGGGSTRARYDSIPCDPGSGYGERAPRKRICTRGSARSRDVSSREPHRSEHATSAQRRTRSEQSGQRSSRTRPAACRAVRSAAGCPRDRGTVAAVPSASVDRWSALPSRRPPAAACSPGTSAPRTHSRLASHSPAPCERRSVCAASPVRHGPVWRSSSPAPCRRVPVCGLVWPSGWPSAVRALSPPPHGACALDSLPRVRTAASPRAHRSSDPDLPVGECSAAWVNVPWTYRHRRSMKQEKRHQTLTEADRTQLENRPSCPVACGSSWPLPLRYYVTFAVEQRFASVLFDVPFETSRSERA